MSHQNVLVVLPDHQHHPLGLGQLGVVHHVETLGRVLLVRLVVDEAGEVRLLAQELHHEELVALVPREREQEGVELLKPLLRRANKKISIGCCHFQLKLTCITWKVAVGMTAATAS